MDKALEKVLESLGPIDWNVYSKLEVFLQELRVWNKSINLVSRKNEDEQLLAQIEDCLFAGKAFLKSKINSDNLKQIVDVGSGAGLPGMVWASMMPKKHFHLVDVNEKRSFFQKEVARKAEMDNVTIHHMPIKDFSLSAEAVLFVSRATGLEVEVKACAAQQMAYTACLFFYSKQQAADYKLNVTLSYTTPSNKKQRKLVLI